MSIKNKWLAVSTLAIVLPISLLAAFKFTGILNEPQQPKTISLSAVTWKMDRPSRYTVIDNQIENSYIAEGVAIIFYVSVFEYREDSPSRPFKGRDGLVFGVCINLSFTRGPAPPLEVRFQPSPNSTIFVSRYWLLEAINATVIEMREMGTHSDEAYLKASTSELSIFLKTQAYWVFADDNDENHQMNLTLEVTYFNGNEYRKVIVPIVLQVLTSTESLEG